MTKKIIIIAGPNGAGKSTFAKRYLPHATGCSIFVNADEIAAALSPGRPEAAAVRAGRLMLQTLAAYAREGRSFAFETTLSGRGYVRMIKRWQHTSYHVKLVFLSLNSAEQAIERVARRVRAGGHHIPEDVIRRRFDAGIRNFNDVYRHCVNHWEWYDNIHDAPILKDEGYNPMKKHGKPGLEVSEPKTISPEAQETLKALYLAACDAHKLAHQNGEKIVTVRDGKVVEIDPIPEMYNQVKGHVLPPWDPKAWPARFNKPPR